MLLGIHVNGTGPFGVENHVSSLPDGSLAQRVSAASHFVTVFFCPSPFFESVINALYTTSG